MAKVLIVEDMAGVRRSIAVILSAQGYDIIEAENGQEGLEKNQSDKPDLVITDILMPGTDGNSLMTMISVQQQRPKIIAISGGGNKTTTDDALRIADDLADAVLRKPFLREELLSAVREALSA